MNEPRSTGYYQQTPYPNPTFQQTQPLPVGTPVMTTTGDYPVTCTCPHCQQSIVTRVEKDTGLLAWLAAGALCVFGCFCGCCLIPFCVDDLKV